MSTDNQQPERHIEYIDGVRILSGYSREEYMAMLLSEAQEAYRPSWDNYRDKAQEASKKRRKAS